MAARGERVPDVDADRNSPPAPRDVQLIIEIDEYEKRIIRYEAAGWAKADTSTFWMEAAVRKETFRYGQGKGYEPSPCEDSEDHKALISFFKELNGHRWNRKFGWIGQEKTMTNPDIRMFAASAVLYEGVETVKLGKVALIKGLYMPGFGLEGTLSKRMFSEKFQSTLVRLELPFNRLKGPLPLEIGLLVNLEIMNFAGNVLEGCIYQRLLSDLIHLRVCNLSDNSFTGKLPECFQHLKKLRVLDLSRNHFEGELPTSLSALEKLQVRIYLYFLYC